MEEKKLTITNALNAKGSDLIKKYNTLIRANNVVIPKEVYSEMVDDTAKVMFLTAQRYALANRKEIMNKMITLMKKGDKQAIMWFADLLSKVPEFKPIQMPKKNNKPQDANKMSVADLLTDKEG